MKFLEKNNFFPNETFQSQTKIKQKDLPTVTLMPGVLARISTVGLATKPEPSKRTDLHQICVSH